jgi:hypothetical protein
MTSRPTLQNFPLSVKRWGSKVLANGVISALIPQHDDRSACKQAVDIIGTGFRQLSLSLRNQFTRLPRFKAISCLFVHTLLHQIQGT